MVQEYVIIGYTATKAEGLQTNLIQNGTGKKKCAK